MFKIVQELLKELFFILRLWEPLKPSHWTAAKQFAEINRIFWQNNYCKNNSKNNILIEGHLAEYGPNYLFRTGLVAKAIQEVVGGEISVVVNGFSYQWQLTYESYLSFGIKKWIFLRRKLFLAMPFIVVFCFFRTVLTFLFIRNPSQLIEINHGHIKVGDLIYDEILRRTKLPTIKFINSTVFWNIFRSWYFYYEYYILFKLKDYKFYVATHTAYPEYGLLCRVALQTGVIVIETSDIQMSTYRGISKTSLPTYHQGINSLIKKLFILNDYNSEEKIYLARESLFRRLNSELDQIDAIKAYSGKEYSKNELIAALNIPPQKKIGFILAHVFVDSPHLSNSMLHNDYYDWLISTINICKDNNEVVWLIKPHPSTMLYGEEGIVESLIKEASSPNIKICPPDLNTRSLATCADVILTVHGTAGLEFSCLGIPVILAGTPFYSGFGFTYEPKSRIDYELIINKASSIERLSQEQINIALTIFGIWEKVFDWKNPVITTELLANVWGSGTERNLVKAYEIIISNLKASDPRKLKLWNFAREAASDALR